MHNRLQRLWLKSIKRVGKTQQTQGKKLIKNLLNAATKKLTTQVKRKPIKPSKPTTLKKPAPPAKASVKRAAPVMPASSDGLWSKFYYTSALADGSSVTRRLEYWLFLPDGVTKPRLPLVVMLHGCKQTAQQFAQGTRMNLLAKKKGFAVLYAQQSMSANRNRCWNWYKKEHQGDDGEPRLIVGAIHKVMRQCPIDPSRIYIGGMSAGASMANIIALQFPDLIAAVGMHSGAVLGTANSPLSALAVMQRGGHLGKSMQAKSQQPIKMPAIFVHGQGDYVVRTVNTTQAVQQFRTINQLSGDSHQAVISDHPRVSGTAKPRHTYRTIDYFDGKKLMIRVCEIAQLEHAWSGGDCSLRFNACEGPDASLLMWNFFALHQRVGDARRQA